MRPASRAGAWRALLIVVALVVIVDQVTKAILVSEVALGERVDFLPFLDFVHVLNEGVAFGFLGGDGTNSVVLITGAALVLVLGWFATDPRRSWAWLAVGLLVGGALGNLADRARQDAVIDFLDLPAWPSFNFADVAITAGAALLIVGAIASTTDKPSAQDEGAESP